MFYNLAGNSLEVFNFLDQLVFRLFMLGSALLTAGLLLRPHWKALRGNKRHPGPRRRKSARLTSRHL